MLLAAIFFAATAFANDSIPETNDGPTIEKATEINIDQTESSIRTLDYIIIIILISTIAYIIWNVYFSSDSELEEIKKQIQNLETKFGQISRRIDNANLDWIKSSQREIEDIKRNLATLSESRESNPRSSSGPQKPDPADKSDQPANPKGVKNETKGGNPDKQEEPASAPAKVIKKLYADSPESNGGLFYAVFEEMQNSNVFVIYQEADSNIAEFDVLHDHQKAVSKILSDPDTNCHDCCEIIKGEGSVYHHLETKKKGVAEKLPSNGKWKVKEKAQIIIS